MKIIVTFLLLKLAKIYLLSLFPHHIPDDLHNLHSVGLLLTQQVIFILGGGLVAHLMSKWLLYPRVPLADLKKDPLWHYVDQ
jgi:hypothetical protein